MEVVERFTPTSGRVLGIAGLVVCVATAVLAVVDGWARSDLLLIGLGATGAALVWAYLLRPQVSLAGPDLVLRRPFSVLRVPLVAIEEMAVRQVLVVRTPAGRHVSSAVGHSLRSMRKRPAGELQPTKNYADFVETRIRQRVDDERAGAGLRRGQEAPGVVVRRAWAWPELAALGLAVLVLLVGILA